MTDEATEMAINEDISKHTQEGQHSQLTTSFPVRPNVYVTVVANIVFGVPRAVSLPTSLMDDAVSSLEHVGACETTSKVMRSIST